MLAVRGVRALARAVVFVLAAAGVVVGATVSAAAATPQTVAGHIEDASGNALANVEVIVADGFGTFYAGSTNLSGDYSIALPDEDFYTIAAGSDSWIWQYTDPEVYVDGTEGSIDFTLQPGVQISGVVTDVLGGAFVGFVDVFAIPVNNPPPSTPGGYPIPIGYIDFHGPTDAADGVYRITVPANDDYVLLAYDESDDYDPQVYLGHNASGCLCDPDLVSIGTTAVAGKDFELYGYADWVHVSIYAERDPVPAAFDGLLVALQRKNTGTGLWDVAASATTDSSGVVDLYGLGAGEYRVVYSELGVALAATNALDYYTSNPYTLTDGGRTLEFGTLTPPVAGGGGCGCGGGPGAFTERLVDMLFPAAASGGGGSGGSGAGNPPHRPRTTISTFTGSLSLPTATPTPTPTPTSSPTPSSSPTSAPSPSPSATPEPEPTQNPFDLWWLWLLLLLIVAAIVFFIVRVLLRR